MLVKVIIFVPEYSNVATMKIAKASYTTLDDTKYQVEFITLKINRGDNSKPSVSHFWKIKSLRKLLKANVIHSHCLLPDVIASMLALLNRKAVYITTLHNEIKLLCKSRFRFYWWFVYFTWLNSISNKDSVVCVNDHISNEIRSVTDKSCVIYNGIPKFKNSIRHKLQDYSSQKLKLLTVCNLLKLKGIEQSILLVNEMENCVLTVVGEGTYKDKLLNLVYKLGITKKVKFVGYDPDPQKYFQASDIYLATSITEGLSLSLLEAMRCGLPILASDIPSHRSILGNDGIFFELFNKMDMKIKFEKMIPHMEKLSEQNYKIYEAKFCEDAMCKGYENNLTRLMS